ncbi:MAG: CvpA family protein [Anaerolineae bacterium]|nr:CvpA family protein [Anaerolineae bacterium]
MLTSIDWLLIFLGVGIVILMTFSRLVRAVFALVALWAATLLSAVLYQEVAFRLQALSGDNPVLFRGIIFDILLLVFFVTGFILTRIAFPVTKLPKIGFLDNLGGLILGIVIAAILISLLNNSFGVMVNETWDNNQTGWVRLRTWYFASQLRPYTVSVLSAYRWLFAPFFRGLPPALYPQ